MNKLLKEAVAEGWTYVEKYGSIYKVEDNELLFIPVNKDNTVDMDGGGIVEFENIEEEDAKELRKMFGENLV